MHDGFYQEMHRCHASTFHSRYPTVWSAHPLHTLPQLKDDPWSEFCLSSSVNSPVPCGFTSTDTIPSRWPVHVYFNSSFSLYQDQIFTLSSIEPLMICSEPSFKLLVQAPAQIPSSWAENRASLSSIWRHTSEFFVPFSRRQRFFAVWNEQHEALGRVDEWVLLLPLQAWKSPISDLRLRFYKNQSKPLAGVTQQPRNKDNIHSRTVRNPSFLHWSSLSVKHGMEINGW